MKHYLPRLLTAVIFLLSISFLPSALAAQWSLNTISKQGSIWVVKDQSSDLMNLTLKNMTSANAVNGQSGSALSFNGRNQQASSTNATKLQAESITLSAWVKPDPRSSFPETGEWIAAQGDNFGLYLTANKRVAFYVKNKGHGWTDVLSPVNQYQFNQWLHIVGTYNAQSHVLKIYVNGKEVGSSPWGSGIGYSTGNGFSIGSMQGQRHFAGSIDEVNVFKTAYSAGQVKKLAKASSSLVDPAPISTPVSSGNTQNNIIKSDLVNAKKWQTPSVTLSAWVYPKQRLSYPDTGEWVASQADNYGLYLTADKRIAFYVKNSGSGWTDVRSSVNSYRFNQWHHITGSFNAATNVLKLYLNGIEVASSPWGSGIGYTTGNDFTIGSMQGSRQFSGQVTQVKAFASALSLARIRQLSLESHTVATTPTNPTTTPTTTPTINPTIPPTIPPTTTNNPVISIDSQNKKLQRQSAAGTVIGKITIELKKATLIKDRSLNIRGTNSASPEFSINTQNEILLKNGVTLSDNQYLLEAIYSSDLGNSNKLPITITIVNGFQGQTIKVIALGDSITEGASYSQENLSNSNVSVNAVVPIDENNEPPYGQSYRSSIAQVQGTSEHGVKIDFIGTKSDDWGGDVEYDGWSGFTSAAVLFGEGSVQPLERLKAQGLIPQADVVFMTLGTNDAIEAGQGREIDTRENLTQIISQMREINPNLVFMLATIIPFDSGNTTIFDFGLADGFSTIVSFRNALIATNEHIPAKNQVIENVANELSTDASPVISVDMASVFAGQQSRLLSDGIHPNNIGERIMAEKWIEAIDRFFDGSVN